MRCIHICNFGEYLHDSNNFDSMQNMEVEDFQHFHIQRICRTHFTAIKILQHFAVLLVSSLSTSRDRFIRIIIVGLDVIDQLPIIFMAFIRYKEKRREVKHNCSDCTVVTVHTRNHFDGLSRKAWLIHSNGSVTYFLTCTNCFSVRSDGNNGRQVF
jgi:hypothetical protein